MSTVKETENGLSVVIGATGAIGSAVVNELVKEKKQVRAIVKNEEKAKKMFEGQDVEIVKADVLKEEEIEKAVEGAEIVYHCVNVVYTKWKKLLPKINSNIIKATEKAEARLAYADNLYIQVKIKVII